MVSWTSIRRSCCTVVVEGPNTPSSFSLSTRLRGKQQNRVSQSRNGSTRISCSGFLVEEDVWTRSDPSRRDVRSNSQQLGSDQWIITSALCVTPFLTKSGSNDLVSSPNGAYASSSETQVEGSGWVLRPDTQVLVHFFDDTLENSTIRFLEASLDFVLPIPESLRRLEDSNPTIDSKSSFFTQGNSSSHKFSNGIAVLRISSSLVSDRPGLSLRMFTDEGCSQVDRCLGMPVKFIGAPFGLLSPSAFTACVFSGNICSIVEQCGFLLDGPAVPGLTGSPVIDEDGFVLAIVCSSSFISEMGSSLSLCLATSQDLFSSLAGDLSLKPFEMTKNISNVTQQKDLVSQSFCHSESLSESSKYSQLISSIVMLRVGSLWGSGIVLKRDENASTRQLVTCRHLFASVVDNTALSSTSSAELAFVRLGDDDLPIWRPATLEWISPFSSIDVALLRCDDESMPIGIDLNDLQITESIQHLSAGSSVSAIGFGVFGPMADQILVCPGIVSHLKYAQSMDFLSTSLGEPTLCLIQSSCAVYKGHSGGLLMDVQSGSPIGMIMSNTKLNGKILVPRMNFSLPLHVLALVVALATGPNRQLDKEQMRDIAGILEHTWKIEPLPSEIPISHPSSLRLSETENPRTQTFRAKL